MADVAVLPPSRRVFARTTLRILLALFYLLFLSSLFNRVGLAKGDELFFEDSSLLIPLVVRSVRDERVKIS